MPHDALPDQANPATPPVLMGLLEQLEELLAVATANLLRLETGLEASSTGGGTSTGPGQDDGEPHRNP